MWIVSFRTWLAAMWLMALVAVLTVLWGTASNVVLIGITATCLAALTVVCLLARRPEQTMSESIRGVVVTRARE